MSDAKNFAGFEKNIHCGAGVWQKQKMERSICAPIREEDSGTTIVSEKLHDAQLNESNISSKW